MDLIFLTVKESNQLSGKRNICILNLPAFSKYQITAQMHANHYIASCHGPTGNVTDLPFKNELFSVLHLHRCLQLFQHSCRVGAFHCSSSCSYWKHRCPKETPWFGDHYDLWLLEWLRHFLVNLNPTFGALGSAQLMRVRPDSVLCLPHPSIQYLNTHSALGSYFLITSCSQLSVSLFRSPVSLSSCIILVLYLTVIC